jgi:D-glycero-alpha-D-manno-heptose 1-phosphate guanylyltransferase
MQAVILAGGLGKRLRPLTHITPKLMLSVYGKPFLEHHIQSLKQQGIKDIVILIGHLGNKIKSYFKDGSEFGVNIRYSEDDQLGTGGAIKNASDILEDEFIVINGDTYLPIDYEALIKAFMESSKLGMITVYNNEDNIANNNILLNSEKIIEYNRTGGLNFTHIDSGVSVFKKSVLDLIDKSVFSLEDDLYPLMINMDMLAHFSVNHRFFDIHVLEKMENIRKCTEIK